MEQTSWDLSPLYPSVEAAEEGLLAFKEYIDKTAAYQGKLQDETALAEYLRLDKEATLLLVRLYYYAEMKSDLNKKDVANAELLSKVELASNAYSSANSFFQPEIIAFGEEKTTAFLKKYPEFAELSFAFRKIFNQQKYVLPAEKEGLVSHYSPLLGEGGTLYSQLTVADGSAKEATLTDGSKVMVSQANWTMLVEEASCEEDRRIIFETLYSYYDAHKSTYGEIYNLTLQAQLATMKARGYGSILEVHLNHNNIPVSVFHNLIEVASEGAEPLKKYYRIRAKALGLEKHRSYDRFLQLAKSDKKFDYEQAKELFFNSIRRFPKTFQEKAHEVLREGYVDVYPAEGKRSGAYSNGGYDLHPYILLNFVGKLDDVFTLAHEAGHSIHTLFAEEAQPTLAQDYTIFVAEIASTFNEHNLLDYLLKEGDLDRNDKVFLLQKAIDEIVGTFYRQTLFAHYEYLMAEKAEKGEPINYQVASSVMEDLYRTYYGIEIAEEKVKPLVWAYIPHLFYTPFYVYQYATSFTSSMLIYERVNAGEEGAFENYLNLLRSGGSDYPVDQVKAAGVGLTTKEPFLAVVRRMQSLVDQLEALLNE
ncbi:MAG: oligoendopeptidase F [Bacilli bacterium]|nr:oligoendopeptidase F [Bacilli bacterium]